MMLEISEENFDATIENLLLAGGLDDPKLATSVAERVTAEDDFILRGFIRRKKEDDDRQLCPIPDDAITFEQAS